MGVWVGDLLGGVRRLSISRFRYYQKPYNRTINRGYLVGKQTIFSIGIQIMSNTQNAIHTQDFWSKLIAKKNVDLPDLPNQYKSDDGSFLIGMVKDLGKGLVANGGDSFEDSWITAETIDGAIFAYPDVDSCFDLSNPMNYGSANSIDAKAFGLIATLMVYSQASFAFEHKHPTLSAIMGNGYHSLRSSFYGFLDVALYPDEIRDTGDELQNERLSLFTDMTEAQKTAIDDMSTGIYSITN